eukprot:7599676-Pyramimonas_sp.AAC.1
MASHPSIEKKQSRKQFGNSGQQSKGPRTCATTASTWREGARGAPRRLRRDAKRPERMRRAR